MIEGASSKVCGVVKKKGGKVCQRKAIVPTKEKGLICPQHYTAYRSHGIVEEVPRICKVAGCDKVISSQELCRKHSRQKEYHGKVISRGLRDPNEIVVVGDIARMTLYDKQGNAVVQTIFDADMVEKVTKFKWHCCQGYAVKNRGRYRNLHHFLVGKPPRGKFTDHINRNKLDNRKCNLRFVTRRQNIVNGKVRSNNRSGKTGVCWSHACKKWCAYINGQDGFIHLGVFEDKQEAIAARLAAEKEHYGEYAPKFEKGAID